MSGSNGNSDKPDYPKQFAASAAPMRGPDFRGYAPPYSPQRTDPDYEKNWQRDPQYDPPPDDTLLGPYQYAALGGAPEYRPWIPSGARVPPDFMYDVNPSVAAPPPGFKPAPPPQPTFPGSQAYQQWLQHPLSGPQPPAPFEALARDLIESKTNVPQDVQAMQQGMVYGPGPVRGRANLLPQFQSMGTTRPLGPGEYIDRGQGQISHEETITVPYGQGKWAVLPSLWLVNGQPMTLDENTAVQLAQQSGLNWPMFNSEDEANAFATQREQRWNQLPPGRTDMQPPLWSRRFPPQ